MKILLWVLLSFTILLSSYASKAISKKDNKRRELFIELGQTFKNDLVKIYLNNKLLVNKRFSTVDSLTGPEILRMEFPRRPFLLTIDVNGKQIKQKSLKLKIERSEDEDYIYESNRSYGFLISYDRDKMEVKLDTIIMASLGRKKMDLDF